MARISTYKELQVYQIAMESAMRIFELTKTFPADERSPWLIRFDVPRDPFALTLPRPGKNGDRKRISSAN